MRKLLSVILLIVFALLPYSSISQVNKSYVNFSLGCSVPILGFGSAGKGDYGYDEIEGYAKPGLQLGLEYAYLLHKNFALSAKLNFSVFPGDNTKIANSYWFGYYQTELKVSDFNYNSLTLLLGPRINTYFNGGMSIYFIPQVGVNRFGSSDFTVSGKTYDSRGNLVNRSFSSRAADNTSGLAYGSTVGFITSGTLCFGAEASLTGLANSLKSTTPRIQTVHWLAFSATATYKF